MKTLTLILLTSLALAAQSVPPEKVTATPLAGQAAVLVQWQVRGHKQPTEFAVQRFVNGVRDVKFRIQAQATQQSAFPPDVVAYFFTDTNNLALPGPDWVYTYRIKAFGREGKGSAWGKQ